MFGTDPVRALLAKERRRACGSASTGPDGGEPKSHADQDSGGDQDRENVDLHHCDEDRDERQERAEDRQFVSKIHGRADPPTVRRMLRRRVASVSEEPPLTARELRRT